MIVGIFDGIIKKFNEKFPRQAVRKFDKITAVNGKPGTANEMRRTDFRQPPARLPEVSTFMRVFVMLIRGPCAATSSLIDGSCS